MKKERIGWSFCSGKYLVASSKYFLFVLIYFLFNSCLSKIEKSYYPEIIDTIELNHTYRKFTPSDNGYQTFPIYYIGKITDTISLPKYPVVNANSPPRIISEKGSFLYDTIQRKHFIKGSLNNSQTNSNNISIYIDTSQLILREGFSDPVNYLVAFEHYPVFVFNLSKSDTLFLPQLPAFGVKVIKSDESIGFGPFIACSTHDQILYIPPQHMLLGLVAKSYGDTRIEAKIIINNSSSNKFNVDLNYNVLHADK